MIEWLMNMEQLVEWELAGKIEIIMEILPRHFVRNSAL
jgi:hypothetical protein